MKEMLYYPIVFMQESDTDEVYQIYKDEGASAALAHLLQWETGDEIGEETDPTGSDDYIYEETIGGKKYRMNINFGLPYFGLDRIEEKKTEA